MNSTQSNNGVNKMSVNNTKVRPEFMTPAPKRNNNKFAYLDEQTVLGKRKYEEAFETCDDERYGQHIDGEFFRENVGHGVLHAETDAAIDDFRAMLDAVFSQPGPVDIIEWCEFYLKNKNLFKV